MPQSVLPQFDTCHPQHGHYYNHRVQNCAFIIIAYFMATVMIHIMFIYLWEVNCIRCGFQYINSIFKHDHPITLHFNALNTNHTCFRTKVCPVVASTQWSTFPNDPEPRLILIANCSLSSKQPSSATKPYNNNTRLTLIDVRLYTEYLYMCHFVL